MVDDISHEGLRQLLRKEGVSFQRVKTWKTSNDPDYEAKKNRVLELYAIADGERDPRPGDPTVVFSVDDPTRDGTGPPAAAGRKTETALRGGVAGPPTNEPPGCATCSPATT